MLFCDLMFSPNPRPLCSSTRVVITEFHGLRGFCNQDAFSHGSGGQKSDVKVSAGLVSSGASVRGLCMVVFSL